MASIHKPDGERNWIIQFYFRGKKFRRSLKVSTKRDAQQLKLLIERKLAEGTFDPATMLQNNNRNNTLSYLAEKWKTHLDKRKDISEGARYQYKLAADIMLKITGDKQLSSITPIFVTDDFLLELEDKYDSPATVKSKMTSLRAMFSYAVRNSYIQKNPFSGAVPGIQQRKPLFFREDEIRKIVEYFSSPDRPKWQQTYFLTMLNTGNRKTEHFKLKWSENVFLDDKLLKFKGKGRHGGKERIVPLNDTAIKLFQTAQRKLGEERVFWQVKSTYTIDSAWQDARERIGLEKYKIHNFRSNRASWLIMKGMSVEKVMQICGWEDYSTYKLYRGLSKEFIEEERNLVNF